MSGPGRQEARSTTCPSAPPEAGSTLLGVVTGPGEVAYLNPGVPATQEMIDRLAGSGIPIENRMRFAGPCMEHRCVQWTGEPGAGRCGLIDHALDALRVDALDALRVDAPDALRGDAPGALRVAADAASLPHCSIRASCRWFAQHKRAACAVCPEVIRRPARD